MCITKGSMFACSLLRWDFIRTMSSMTIHKHEKYKLKNEVFSRDISSEGECGSPLHIHSGDDDPMINPRIVAVADKFIGVGGSLSAGMGVGRDPYICIFSLKKLRDENRTIKENKRFQTALALEREQLLTAPCLQDLTAPDRKQTPVGPPFQSADAVQPEGLFTNVGSADTLCAVVENHNGNIISTNNKDANEASEEEVEKGMHSCVHYSPICTRHSNEWIC